MTEPSDERKEYLRRRVRQLILMRETGPKRAAWHEMRMRLIWRLHDKIRDLNVEEPGESESELPTQQPIPD
jgi:hypothetical protein